jgi:hypothetical protein
MFGNVTVKHPAWLSETNKIFFFFSKTEEEGKTGPVWAGVGGTSGSGEGLRKGCRSVNMVEIVCTQV